MWSRHVFSVGDLHGDYEALSSILQRLGLTTATGRWSGGTATLVQTGDVVDRGPSSQKLLRAFSQLQEEAALAGGRVVLLYGNHEVMEMQGDTSYVNADELSGAGGLEVWSRLWSPAGDMGRLVRGRLQAVAVVGGVLFSHAGVLPQLAAPFSGQGSDAASSLNALVQRVLEGSKEELGSIGHVDAVVEKAYMTWHEASVANGVNHTSFLAVNPGLVFGEHGPFWCHFFGTDGNETKVCEWLNRTLAAFGASRMVVGHMPQAAGRVRPRCSGRLLLADTDISEAMQGAGLNHPSAVEFDTHTGEAFAHYWPPRKEGLVSCGGHRAASCALCGDSMSWCNGQCSWLEGRCQALHPSLPPEGVREALPQVAPTTMPRGSPSVSRDAAGMAASVRPPRALRNFTFRHTADTGPLVDEFGIITGIIILVNVFFAAVVLQNMSGTFFCGSRRASNRRPLRALCSCGCLRRRLRYRSG
ncbi:unnamed protein product [Prorocentrum cordatum]|nr:unnamed protein product [Polarella glacialis]